MNLSWEIREKDHDIQNPISPEKIRLLGEYVRLTPESRVLDIACGQGGPASILAGTFGCSILGLEIRPGFADEARRRSTARGLESRVEVRTCDASTFSMDPGAWDVALCIGAAFVWGNIEDAARALAPAVRAGGFVAVGEPFWREWPLPGAVDQQDFVGLPQTVNRFEASGLVTTGIIGASEDDWDRYESLQWRATQEWLVVHAEGEDAAEIRSNHHRTRGQYLSHDRSQLGWAIFVGMKT